MILGIDTSGPTVSLAIYVSNEIIAENTLPGARSHLENLLPGLDSMLEPRKLAAKDIQGIAIGLGPGSFTGTRVGIAAARAFAQALAIPILGMSSLDVIAWQAGAGTAHIIAATDARRNEAYRAIYLNTDSGPHRISDYETESARAILEESTMLERVILAGNAYDAYPILNESELITAPRETWEPKAATLCRILGDRLMNGESSELVEITPIYIRPSDAELAC